MSETGSTGLPPSVNRDFDLAFEEEHAQLKRQYDDLRKVAADLLTRNEHLKENYDTLVEEKEQVDSELEVLQKSSGGDYDIYIDRLKAQLQEANTLIEEQENQLETSRIMSEKQQKELNKLRTIGDKAQRLEDELATANVQIVELSKKANTVDHYQQKLRNLSKADEENARLRRQLEILESNQVAFDEVHHENEKLKNSNVLLTQRFHGGEQEIFYLTSQRKALENELRSKEEALEKYLAQKAHDEFFIKELQAQLQAGPSGPTSPASPNPDAPAMRSLEEELNQIDSPNQDLEISRLKAEIQLLKSTAAGTTNTSLRIELDASEKMRKQLEADLQQMSEKYGISQRQLDALITEEISNEKLVDIIDRLQNIGSLHLLTGEFYRDETLSSLRKLHNRTKEELEATKSKLEEIQAGLISRDRDLLNAQTDCMF